MTRSRPGTKLQLESPVIHVDCSGSHSVRSGFQVSCTSGGTHVLRYVIRSSVCGKYTVWDMIKITLNLGIFVYKFFPPFSTDQSKSNRIEGAKCQEENLAILYSAHPEV